MTPTTSEREARELLAQYCECGGQMQFTKTDDCIRAIIAALTRQEAQQGGEPKCPKCSFATLLYECPACSATNYPHQQEAQGAVAKPERLAGFTQYHLDHWTDDDFRAHIPAVREALQQALRATTPPAPVDVLGLVEAAYMTWPEDIRKKLSLHDLRRMSGWAPKPSPGDWRIESLAP